MGKDGRIACERWEGKQHKIELAEFGECVHTRHSAAAKKPTKLAQREDGIWVGVADESDEVYVGAANGVRITRATAIATTRKMGRRTAQANGRSAMEDARA